jgi:hypothetical protein
MLAKLAAWVYALVVVAAVAVFVLAWFDALPPEVPARLRRTPAALAAAAAIVAIGVNMLVSAARSARGAR